MRLRDVSRWIAVVRLLAVPFAVFQVASSTDFPAGYRPWAWGATGVLAAGAVVLFAVSRAPLPPRGARIEDALAVAFDFAIVTTFVLVYHYEAGTPTPQLLFLPLVEAAVRFGMAGALAIAVFSSPVAVEYEELRSDRFGGGYRWNYVTFQIGVELLMALIVGWLVRRLADESRQAE